MALQRLGAGAGILTLVASAFIATPATAVVPEAAPVTHTVVMGAVDPSVPDTTPRPPASAGRTDRFEYLAYYPDHLQVHRGDTVHFRRDGFHTVTFSPSDQPRAGWLRRDEIEGVTGMYGNLADPTCGHDASVPDCVLSGGEQVVSSGWDDLRLKIDAPEGSYTYYCLLHPGMEGELQVVGDGEPIPTPAEVDALRQQQVATDTENGAALIAASQTPKVEAVGDHLRWTIKAGDVTSDDRVAVLRYLPSNLSVAPGDEVVVEVPEVGSPAAGRAESAAELHTATFPRDAVGDTFGMARYINPSCDADDPAAGAPGLPGVYPAFVMGCPPGTTLEFLFHPHAWSTPTRAPGDSVTTQLTVHDSGLLAGEGTACRTACDAWTAEPFATRSSAVFPNAGTFSFVCLVHPEWGMSGAVRVVD